MPTVAHILMNVKKSVLPSWCARNSLSNARYRNNMELLNLLNARIDSVNFQRIKDDLRRFIPNASVLDIWSAQYFPDFTLKLEIST